MLSRVSGPLALFDRQSAPDHNHPLRDKEVTHTVAATITTLTDSTFDEELAAASSPVLVDFWAEWCGPCLAVAPVLEEIANEQGDRLRIAKVNVDDSVGLARRFEVMSIPTMILFSEGQPQVRLVGAKPKGKLLEELQAFL